MNLCEITAEQTHDLRRRILLADRPPEAVRFPRDAESIHLAIVDEGRILAIASTHPEPMTGDAREGDWRLRGMAVDDRLQRGGIGSKLLLAFADRVAGEGASRLWFNARTHAAGFYAKHGFTQHGDVFDIEHVGPHVVMYRDVAG